MSKYEQFSLSLGARKPDIRALFYSILEDKYCRQVIGYFQSENTEIATVDELVEHAVADNDHSTDRKREAVLLHHQTLPKLADADILVYDSGQMDVRHTGHEGLESLLDQIHEDESERD